MAKKGGLTNELDDDDDDDDTEEWKQARSERYRGGEEPCNERRGLYGSSRAMLPAKTEVSSHVGDEKYLEIHHGSTTTRFIQEK